MLFIGSLCVLVYQLRTLCYSFPLKGIFLVLTRERFDPLLEWKLKTSVGDYAEKHRRIVDVEEQAIGVTYAPDGCFRRKHCKTTY